MTAALRLRAALIGGLVVAIGTGTSPGQAAVPGAASNLRAAIAQQRAALRTLPQAGGSPGGSYARSIAHVNAAVSDLLAVKTALATAAVAATPLPHLSNVERLLDAAITVGDHAGTSLSEALTLIDRGVQADSSYVVQARSSLRQALNASTALAKLLD